MPLLPPRWSLLLCTAAALLASHDGRAQVPSALASKLQPFVDEGVVTGAVTIVATKDRVLSLDVIGKSDLQTGTPMRADSLFWIASMTKPMTAVCIAMLVDEGKLSVDDPVEKHLPEFGTQWQISEQTPERRVLVKPARPITIRDLLTHTGGLSDAKGARPTATLAELSMGYANAPLQFPAGSKWSYDNPGINTLGRIVEVASGLPFAEFIQTRLFEPLGMRDTTFWPSAEQAARLARSYKPGKTAGTLEEAEIYLLKGLPATDRNRTPFPAAGLFSTAGDVTRFYQMMLGGGTFEGRTVLKPETVAEWTRTQSGELKTGFTEGMSWGFGFQVVKQPAGATAMLSPGTFGHGGAYATNSWGDPVKGLVYVLMIQRAGLPNADASDIRRVFQEAGAGLR